MVGWRRTDRWCKGEGRIVELKGSWSCRGEGRDDAGEREERGEEKKRKKKKRGKGWWGAG